MAKDDSPSGTINAKPDNPPANSIPTGVDETQLLDAVRNSGYPLQTVVAQQLVGSFNLVEEWGYVDRATKEHRSLDIYAHKELQGSTALRPRLALLVECKRADLPFIFFAPAVPRVPKDFPVICGFARTAFELHKRGTGHREITAADFLSARDFDFVGGGPTVSSAFARVERKGKSFDLSGSVPFNSVVLPLMSALDHCRVVWAPVGRRSFYSPVVLLCVGVVDSAMLVARGTPEEPELTLEPWVRVVREEAVQEHNWWDSRHYVVDFVHRAFVENYVSSHALPFATALAERMLEKENMVIAGKACVPDWDAWHWQEMELAT